MTELAHTDGLEDTRMGVGRAGAEQQAGRDVELGVQVVVFIANLHRTLPCCIGMMGMMIERNA
jgi:hypothetical protein